MRTEMWLASVTIVAATVCASVEACDLCAIYAVNRAGADVGPGLFAGAAEQVTSFGTIQIEGAEVPNTWHQHLDSSIAQAFIGYNLNSRVAIQFNLPVLYRSFRRVDHLTQVETGTVSGIGDAALLGNFVAYQAVKMSRAFRWSFQGGIKFPTGNTGRLAEEAHEDDEHESGQSAVHGHDLTLGSGSYDGVIGTSFYARHKRWFAPAQLQYAIRTEGDYKYRFGNDLTWGGGPGYYISTGETFTLAIQALVSGEEKALDRLNGHVAEDTGTSTTYLGPQLTLTWGTNLSLESGLDVPVAINNTSRQIVQDWRVRAAFTWHF